MADVGTTSSTTTTTTGSTESKGPLIMANNLTQPTPGMAALLNPGPEISQLLNDPVHVINVLFPTEQSFAQLPTHQKRLQSKLYHIDTRLHQLIHQPSVSPDSAVPVGPGQSPAIRTSSSIGNGLGASTQSLALTGIDSALKSLHTNIVDIKSKAQQAEQTVQYITKDIKSLDRAKRNLVDCMKLLRRLQMLVSALDQLRGAMQRKQYQEMSSLVQVVSQLMDQFKTYKSIAQISQVLSHAQQCLTDLKRMVLSDFECAFTTQGKFIGNPDLLRDACWVIDMMQSEVKTQLMDWYLELQLREYRAIFANNDEVGGLDALHRRFGWFRKCLGSYDEEHAVFFPVTWYVGELLSERFCGITRSDLTTVLERVRMGLDSKTLIKALQATLEFETSLSGHFKQKATAYARASKEAAGHKPANFEGKVTSVFEPFMYIYIETEDRTITDMLEKFKSKTSITEEDMNTGVFTVSTDLFLFYRQTLVSMAKMNTGKAFLDLCNLFKKGLVALSDLLNAKLPKDDKKFSTEDLRVASLVLTTADYCQITAAQLEERVKERISPELKASVDFSRETELFLVLVTTSIQALVKLVMGSLSNAFTQMSKIPWSTLQSVGDQSEYVTQIAQMLTSQITLIRSIISGNHTVSIPGAGESSSQTVSTTTGGASKQFKWFCDKFVDQFVPHYLKMIYGCKPISEVGAEQLLLDTHAIKTILLTMQSMGAPSKTPPSAIFTKFVTRGIAKAETLLKVVLTPLDPPETIIKNYMILCGEGLEEELKQQLALMGEAGADPALAAQQIGLTPTKLQELRDGFVKILELKGVKRSDQLMLLDLFQKRMQKTGVAMPPPQQNTSAASLPGVKSIPPAPGQPDNQFSNLASGIAGAFQLKNMGTSMTDAGTKFNMNFKKLGSSMQIKPNWLNRQQSTSSGGAPPPPPNPK